MMFVNPDTEFYPLLKRCIDKYPDVPELPLINHCNISYELCGYLNHHLIIYDYPIDLFILFGVKHNNMLVNVDEIFTFENSPPKASKVSGIWNPQDEMKYGSYVDCLIEHYKDEQKTLEAGLDKDKNGLITGVEGTVWNLYCESSPNYWTLFKLKPPSIEEIHWGWAKAEKITKHGIIATIQNATEDIYPVTFEAVEDLLLEEYTEESIGKYRDFIDLNILNINSQKMYEKEVIEFFKEHKLDGFDKGYVLRYYAPDWGRKQTTRIYNVLLKYGLL